MQIGVLLRVIVVHLLKSQIVFSLIAIVVSFSFYIAPFSAVLLTCEQMNEILLAVFGAGVSALFVGVMEYWHRMHELESDLLNTAEPLISAVAGLAECSIESIADVHDSSDLLIAYFIEESNNALWEKGTGILPESHDKRNCIIQNIEGCSDDECESFATDPNSSSSRYIQRVKCSIIKTTESYRSCDKKFSDTARFIDGHLARFSYLASNFESIPFLKDLPGAKKTLLLQEFADAKKQVSDALQPAFSLVRLFDQNDSGFDQLLSMFMKTEKQWLKRGSENGASGERNSFAYSLFEPLSEFAAITKSPVAKHYIKPWWDVQ